MSGLWDPILRQYGPTFVNVCRHAAEWADEIATDLLKRGMLKDLTPDEQQVVVAGVLIELGRPDTSRTHNRHVGYEAVKGPDLNITLLEDDQVLQDAVLCVHHAFMISIAYDQVLKIVQNDSGITVVNSSSATGHDR